MTLRLSVMAHFVLWLYGAWKLTSTYPATILAKG